MIRVLVLLLVLLLVAAPTATFAQTQPQPQPETQQPFGQSQTPDLGSLDLRRALLASAGALIGISLIQTLQANPGTAGWITWLSGRLVIVFGAFVGNRLFGAFYDVANWLGGEEATAKPAGGV